MKMLRTATVVSVCALIAGTAFAASYDDQMKDIEKARRSGGMPAAIKQLDKSAKSDKQKAELLYNMERGQLQRMNSDIPQSLTDLQKADDAVKEWEENAQKKVAGVVGATLLSERLKSYEGQDYEKVWVTTLMALNRLATNDLDNARVDIKRTHEREALIATVRAKETEAAEKEAKEKGAESKTKELNGYPVETLNSPEVLELKNGYQNALSHYLSGFVYELNNEAGLAAAGYRKSIELRPGAKVLEDALQGLDDRTSPAKRRAQTTTDVLFIVEAGNAPARVSKEFTIPLLIPGGPSTVSMAYPTIVPSKDPVLANLSVNGNALALDNVVDLNVMARRSLKDEMPGLVARNVTRAVTKGVAQKEIGKANPLLGLGAGLLSAVTEKADDRSWRSLPERVYLARASLPPGEHKLSVGGRDIGTVKISGRYAIVPVRLLDDGVLQLPVSNFGTLAAAQ
jgi:hypothetical protein